MGLKNSENNSCRKNYVESIKKDYFFNFYLVMACRFIFYSFECISIKNCHEIRNTKLIKLLTHENRLKTSISEEIRPYTLAHINMKKMKFFEIVLGEKKQHKNYINKAKTFS